MMCILSPISHTGCVSDDQRAYELAVRGQLTHISPDGYWEESEESLESFNLFGSEFGSDDY